MAKLRVAINGMGRIGRTILRAWYEERQDDFDIVAVNNPGTPSSYVHLLKYDSIQGKFNADIRMEGGTLRIGDKNIRFNSTREPKDIPWADDNVDLVIDATGKFKDKDSLSQHLGSTVKKVIMCAPGKNLDGTFVVGINHETYSHDDHHVVSNASCTTNCLAPVAKVLNDKFGIENGLMTTIHSYTSDQNILDGSHKDMRRSRAAALSMIPTTTGAAKAVGLVIPELNGKLDGFAVRVPTPNVSVVDLVANLKTEATKEEINNAIREASEGDLKGVLGYEEQELVSIDFVGRSESSIFDSSLTNVNGKTIKVLSWYDNEMGFSHRVIDLAKYMGDKL